MNHKVNILITLILMAVLYYIFFYFSEESKLRCIDELRAKSKQSKYVKEIIQAVKDSVLSWHLDGVPGFGYDQGIDNWIYEEFLLFSKDSSKASSCVYAIPADTNQGLQPIMLYIAEKKGEGWHIFLRSMPHIAYGKYMNNNTAWTESGLRLEYERQIYKYINFWSCRVKQKKIDEILQLYFNKNFIYRREEGEFNRVLEFKKAKMKEELKMKEDSLNSN